MIVKLPISRRYNKVFNSIFIVYNRYIRFVRYLPYREVILVLELADLFFDAVIALFGLPELIISDRGTLFTSSY